MPHNLLLSPEPNHRWSPRHLQAMSYLYGLHTPDSDKAKVLELGCGMGANLLPFALSYPNGHATGIDIDENKITTGQQHLDTHHIKNISLYSADIATLLESELEQYDYILIRGLFAQTDLTTRTALLSWCQKHLSPTGIICIGYHTYPGSKITDSLYEALAFHAAQSDHPEEQVTGIKAMLGFMSEGLSPNNPLHHQIKPALEILTDQSDEQLYIETLGGLHNPCYFIEFANSLAETGLCYVGDADAHTEIPAHWGDETERLTQVVNPQQNKLIGQQYLDLLCGRSTRLSILTHASHYEKIEFEPNIEKLMDLQWSGSFYRPTLSESNNTNISFKLPDNSFIIVKNPLTREILDILEWNWPLSISPQELREQSAQGSDFFPKNHTIRNEKFKKSLSSLFIQQNQNIRFCLNSSPYKKYSQHSLSYLGKPLSLKGKTINLWHDSYTYPQDQEINLKKYSELSIPHEEDTEEEKKEMSLIKSMRSKGLVVGDHDSWANFYHKKIYSEINNEKKSLIDIPHLLFNAIRSKKQQTTEKNKNTKQIENLIKNKEVEKAALLCLKNIKHYKNFDIFFYKYYADKLVNINCDEFKTALYTILINPQNLSNYLNLSLGLKYSLDDKQTRYQILKQLINTNNNNYLIYDNLGIYFKDINDIFSSYKYHQKAYELSKNKPAIISNYATAASLLGESEKSLSLFEEMVKIAPKDDFYLFSNYLFNSIHAAHYSLDKLLEIHIQYGKLVDKWTSKNKINKKQITKKNKKIKIGFISGDLREHAVTKFTLPYFKEINKNNFDIYIYNNFPKEDNISNEIQNYASKWINIFKYDHLPIAQKIAEDNINILIDLSGHTGYNRLPVFGLKPAPVQISWIGYPATTGLSTMDYYLTYSDYMDLDNLQEQFTEQLLYLDVNFPFETGIDLPEITPIIPASKNNYFTFASFNRTQKISNTVLKTWAEIMSHCPNDKLLIANIPDEETSQGIKNKLISYGVQEDQLIFKNRVGLEEYLQLHNEVDLLLDTFPYAGGTTAFHAISMGLPAIHLAGNSIYNYQSLYPRCGLHDFMASSIDNYKAKALLWRTQLDELQNLRHSLRNKLNQSTKETDHPVRVFERAMEYAWKNYLDGNSAKSAVIK